MAETEIRVRYEETDRMDVVYYANYITWLEVARTELFRELGYSYDQLEEAGIILPVVNVNCNYHAPARYDDLVKIETEITELKRSKIEFSYKIYNQEGDLLTTATTLHAFINPEFKPVSLEKELPKIWALLQQEMK